MRRRIARLALCAFMLPAAHCGPSEDPVVALIDDIVEAAGDRDAAAVSAHLAENLDAGGQGKAEIADMLRRYFAAYQGLDVSYSDLQSVRKAGSARATFQVRMTGVPRSIGGLGDLVPRAATYEFSIVLREDDGEWLITQATYAAVD